MFKFVRWNDDDAITHDPLRMRNAVKIEDVIDLDESHLLWCVSVRMEEKEGGS
jgi:hypothetical protein